MSQELECQNRRPLKWKKKFLRDQSCLTKQHHHSFDGVIICLTICHHPGPQRRSSFWSKCLSVTDWLMPNDWRRFDFDGMCLLAKKAKWTLIFVAGDTVSVFKLAIKLFALGNKNRSFKKNWEKYRPQKCWAKYSLWNCGKILPRLMTKLQTWPGKAKSSWACCLKLHLCFVNRNYFWSRTESKRGYLRLATKPKKQSCCPKVGLK